MPFSRIMHHSYRLNQILIPFLQNLRPLCRFTTSKFNRLSNRWPTNSYQPHRNVQITLMHSHLLSDLHDSKHHITPKYVHFSFCKFLQTFHVARTTPYFLYHIEVLLPYINTSKCISKWLTYARSKLGTLAFTKDLTFLIHSGSSFLFSSNLNLNIYS